MNKIIKSQDGQQIHFMTDNAPCYFNVAPTPVDGKTEDEKTTLYSVGINNISFGIFKKKDKAEGALLELENFLLDKSLRFQIPADK